MIGHTMQWPVVACLYFSLTFIFAFEVSTQQQQERTYKTTLVNLSIPWPSGIIVNKVEDREGNVLRLGLVQHNVISLRPAWNGIHVFEHLFNTSQCNDIIVKAEEQVSAIGWPIGRHVDFVVRPTNDLPLHAFLSPADLQELVDTIELKIFPFVASKFNLDTEKLSLSDLFLTKYDANVTNRRHLDLHRDKSPFSFVVVLNDGFEGGGTLFDDVNEVWRPDTGGVLVFSGARMHGGR
jgi:hypothetical protein